MAANSGAAKYDIVIEQGATFTRTVTFTAGIADLTNYSARMQVRRRISDTDTLLDLTVGNGITMTTTAITITVEAEDTAALNFDSAVYDLEIESPDGVVTRLLYGPVVLSREVTR